MRGNGFTLLEVMLSMTILALLAGLSLPVYESFMRRNDLDLTTQQLASSLRRAQTFARAGNHDSAWSVEVQPTVVTLFRGTNFSARDQTYDAYYWCQWIKRGSICQTNRHAQRNRYNHSYQYSQRNQDGNGQCKRHG